MSSVQVEADPLAQAGDGRMTADEFLESWGGGKLELVDGYPYIRGQKVRILPLEQWHALRRRLGSQDRSEPSERLVTTAEFMAMPEGAGGHELEYGRIVEKPMPNREHGEITGNVTAALKAWNRPRKAGSIGPEIAHRLERDPDLTRLPDVAFTRAERLAGTERRGAVLMAPDLVVEVISPDDRPGRTRRRFAEYLDTGVLMIWEIRPPQRQVLIHTPDGAVRTLDETAVLEGFSLLPEFVMLVADVFEPDC